MQVQVSKKIMQVQVAKKVTQCNYTHFIHFVRQLSNKSKGKGILRCNFKDCPVRKETNGNPTSIPMATIPRASRHLRPTRQKITSPKNISERKGYQSPRGHNRSQLAHRPVWSEYPRFQGSLFIAYCSGTPFIRVPFV